jgi:hypothetical protein
LLCNSIARARGLKVFDPIDDSKDQQQQDPLDHSMSLKLIRTLSLNPNGDLKFFKPDYLKMSE